MNAKPARTFFIAALALYTLWIGALVALAVVSADRPGAATTQSMPGPARIAPE